MSTINDIENRLQRLSASMNRLSTLVAEKRITQEVHDKRLKQLQDKWQLIVESSEGKAWLHSYDGLPEAIERTFGKESEN